MKSRTRHRRTSLRICGMAAMALGAVVALGTGAGAMSAQTGFIQAKHIVAAPKGAAGLCSNYSWACSSGQRHATVSADQLKSIKQVNLAVNRRVREISDVRQFQVEERWTLPTSRGGDCEDFALLKKMELIRRGIPAHALLIATVLDHNRNGHAVLVVRTDRGDVVLDNLTNRIKRWEDTGYIFLRMQNPDAPSKWVLVGASG